MQLGNTIKFQNNKKKNKENKKRNNDFSGWVGVVGMSLISRSVKWPLSMCLCSPAERPANPLQQ